MFESEGAEAALGHSEAFGGTIECSVGSVLRCLELKEVVFGIPVVQGEVKARAGNIPEETCLAEMRIGLKEAGPVAMGPID